MPNLASRMMRYVDCYRNLDTKRHPQNLEQAIQFCIDNPILLAQVRSEITELGKHLAAAPPKYSLEIGTNYGGTLLLLCTLSAPDATIISVDLPAGPFGGGYPLRKIPLYHRFARGKQRLRLLRGDAHLPETRRRVEAMLDGHPLDYLFIDADHTYEGVSSDFSLYSPLVRPGGMVAFHDIATYNPDTKCKVNRFWQEIKTQYRHLEFIEGMRNGKFPIAVTGEPMETSGIGVLFMPTK
jgi:predicted O-methyltransferase YrrM